MTPEEKLQSLGFELKKRESFAPAMAVGKITGNLLYLSGATPPDKDGKPWNGRVGETYTVEEGYEAARLTAVAQLEMAWSILGNLSRIKQVVKVLGMVNCAPGFTETPAVMHGFSDLYLEILGEKGKHARSAVGLQALPGNSPIEVETIFEIE
jgi:enamine deaminase RidA (YjgF/YER057c/UK114 family)